MRDLNTLNSIKLSRKKKCKLTSAGKYHIAQGILESNAGQSTLAREANNHFGIKCHDNWDGKTFYLQDDDKDANGNPIQSCFRKYKKPETSFEDHSDFLSDPKKYYRYGPLFNLNPRDYRSWAYGLQSAGYASDPSYGDKLIRIIETYHLDDYDTATPNGDIATTPGSNSPGSGSASGSRGIGSINDVKTVRATSGQTLQDIARRYGINPSKLACYNDCQIAVSQVLDASEIIFLSNKRNKWRGKAKEHYVRQEETMFQIAQTYGIKLMKLYTLNNMQGGTEPVAGERIKLKGRKRKDSVKVRTDIPIKPPIVTQPRQNNPNNTTKPTTPPLSTDPSPFKPDSTLFEIGEGGVNQPSTNTPNTNGKPATTGTSRPDVPNDPAGTTPTTGTQPSPPNTGGVKPTPPSNPSAGTSATPAGFHTVIKGDTLYNISKRYGLSVDQLKQMNGLPSNDIKIGQLLKVK